MIDNKTRRDVHEELAIKRCLGVGQNVIYLATFKAGEETENKDETSGMPANDWGISFPEVYAFDLHTSVWTETGIMFEDAPIRGTFSVKTPNGLEQFVVWWYG
jgi:hypothetical protein